MSTIRRMDPMDLLNLNLTNLDYLTENYDLNYYLQYLIQWPSLFNVVEDCDGKIQGYIMGKTEEQHPSLRSSPHYTPWHGHITVLTVAPSARRQGYATALTHSLERASDRENAWFVDLFVRASNTIAVDMYRKMGYSVYRRVVGYYSDNPYAPSGSGEDAFDMRKPLSRDKDLIHWRENGEDFPVQPEDVY